MRKLIFVFVVLGLFTACNQEKTIEDLKKELEKKKIEKVEIQDFIDSLHSLINTDSLFKPVLTPVTVKLMEPEPFHHYFEATGSVEAYTDAFISPEIGGQIKSIPVEEGQRVTKGQVLAKLKTEITSKSIEELRTRLELAVIAFEKQERLWSEKIGTEMQFLQMKNNKESLEKSIETLEAQIEMSTIRAPFSGIVDEILMKEGELAMPGRQIVQLVNLSKLVVNADVSESYLSKVKKGDTIEVGFPSYPDMSFKIPVYRIGNVINPGNRTFKLQLRLDNVNEKLKPNIMANLKIMDFSTDSAFVLPSIIIKQDLNKGNFVFEAVEVDGKTIARKIFVKTGISYRTESLITEGITPGQKIIVAGFNMVSTGDDVKIK